MLIHLSFYIKICRKKFTAMPPEDQYELVVVDDGSGDDSWEVMKSIAGKDKNVVLVKLSRNFGSHAAVLAGVFSMYR